MKKVVKFNETQLKRIVAESVRKILSESTIKYPDYETLFRGGKDLSLQLRQQVCTTRDYAVMDEFRKYMDGFYAWIANSNKYMIFDENEYCDEDLVNLITSFNDSTKCCSLTQFDNYKNEIEFKGFGVRDYQERMANYFESPRDAFPRIRPPFGHEIEFINQYSNDIPKMVEFGNGYYNKQTREISRD